MAYAFALHANEPLTQGVHLPETRDVEWFKTKLQELQVSPLTIVWGDYKEHFSEIPEHLMDQYLHFRKRLLHRDALEAAKRAYEHAA